MDKPDVQSNEIHHWENIIAADEHAEISNEQILIRQMKN